MSWGILSGKSKNAAGGRSPEPLWFINAAWSVVASIPISFVAQSWLAKDPFTRQRATLSTHVHVPGIPRIRNEDYVDFEKALEFAVIASWDDLLKPNDNSSIHVEYANVDSMPIVALEMWATYKGHGNRVCDYWVHPSNGAQLQRTQFSNSYASQTLAETLDLIMLNQGQFTRPAGRGVNGLVRVAAPTKEVRASVAEWWHAMMTELVRKTPPL